MKHILLTAMLLMCVLGVVLIRSQVAAAAPSPPYPTDFASVNVTSLSIKAKSSWPWYVTRASGLTAAVLLILLMLSGIGQLTGFSYRFMEPLMSWSLHRALAIAFGATVVVHGTVLLFDKYVSFNVFQILFPFVSHYQPAVIFGLHLGSLYVAYGIIASYIIAVLIYTSLYWINTRQSKWRFLHYLGYLLAVLVFLHGLYLGTDIAHGVIRVVWWVGGIAVGVAILSRLRRVWSIKQPK